MKKGFWKAEDSDKATKLKEKGNEYFSKGKYSAAIDMYTEAIVRVIELER